MVTLTRVVMRLGAALGAAITLLVGGAAALGRALPDSNQLAYTTQEFAADARQLHLIDVERNLRRELAMYYAMDDLVWSPDGEWLAFQADEPAQIFVYQPFGGEAPRSLQSTDEFAIDTQPAWIDSGEGGGERIAFLSLQHNQWSIKVADLTDGRIDTVNVLPDQVNTPAWSPDGQLLTYSSHYGLRQAIYVADLSGNVRQITRSIGTDLLPEWSPDEAGRIAFFSDRDGGWNIYVIDAAQTLDENDAVDSGAVDSAQRVTTIPIGLLNFGWSADGHEIVFTGVNYFQHELYVQTLEAGSAARQLTQGMEADESAVWSPDNRLIAYIFWADFPEIRVIEADNPNHSRRFADQDIVTSSLTWRP